MNFLKFASIPLAVFVVFFGIPRLISTLINSHSDVGLVAVVMMICGIVGFVCNRAYNVLLEKEKNNED